MGAHLDRQGELSIDAVAGLVALLWCHFVGDGSLRWLGFVDCEKERVLVRSG